MLLQHTPSKRCFTVSGWLFHEGKILLVKHKMLGMWLAPGGHVDENELPHHAVEREFLEETGIKVGVVSAVPVLPSGIETENLPMPFLYNLHWINRPGEKKARKNGEICEQHYIFAFFVEPEGKLNDLDDSDDGIDEVRWFTKKEVQTLKDTSDTIQREALYVFDHHPAAKRKGKL